MEDFIERRIITGLIISKDYLERVQKFWNSSFLESPEFRKVANWCMEYFDKYKTAPDSDIEAVYMEKLKGGNISKSEAQYIEEVLNDLSNEYGRDTQFNSAYLYDQTVKYFKSQELERHQDEVEALREEGKIKEAEELARSYTSTILDDLTVGLDLSSNEALDRVERAFNETAQRVLSYPGAIGAMVNDHLVRGGFVSFLGPEKRGKTFLLLEMALRSIRQKANVAFFEAGDMTENQLLKRVCVYTSRRSDHERYCREHFRPVGDCIYNQLDICTRKDRNCDHGIFEINEEDFKKDVSKYVNMDTLKEKYNEFPDYEPCDSFSCPYRKGTVWIAKVQRQQELTAKKAKKGIRRFFRKYRRRFKLVTYPAGTLTTEEMKSCLHHWERNDGFVPDIIIVDYADLLSAGTGVSEFRHKQDRIWKNLRALSQERHALLLTATQADANSYTKGRLALSNFSEDKRKYGHVTAMYGLNQDPGGREKKLGILRINEIVVREGEFNNDHEVSVLQDLYQGRPYLESYWQFN